MSKLSSCWIESSSVLLREKLWELLSLYLYLCFLVFHRFCCHSQMLTFFSRRTFWLCVPKMSLIFSFPSSFSLKIVMIGSILWSYPNSRGTFSLTLLKNTLAFLDCKIHFRRHVMFLNNEAMEVTKVTKSSDMCSI